MSANIGTDRNPGAHTFSTDRPLYPELHTPGAGLHGEVIWPTQPPENPADSNYVRPCPAWMGAEDVAFLRLKGALTIPPIRLRNQLLGSYVQFVHPYLPVLDLDDFLRPICCDDGSEQLSLMLFQAVMFAGAAFVDSNVLSEAGYGDRRCARRMLFQRVKVSYLQLNPLMFND